MTIPVVTSKMRENWLQFYPLENSEARNSEVSPEENGFSMVNLDMDYFGSREAEDSTKNYDTVGSRVSPKEKSVTSFQPTQGGNSLKLRLNQTLGHDDDSDQSGGKLSSLKIRLGDSSDSPIIDRQRERKGHANQRDRSSP